MAHKVPDPIRLANLFWPDVYFYEQQREIAYSFWNNRQTYVAAANKMGKDFIAGALAVLFASSRYPFRLVTTSAKEDHLDVLWGEIGRFLKSAHLTTDEGGPFLLTHRMIRKIVNGEICKISYVKGMVAGHDSIAAMQGHHVTPRSLEEANDGIVRAGFMCDESSSVAQAILDMASTWSQTSLIFGNAWDCNNDFKWAFKGRPGAADHGGDLLGVTGNSLFRKCLRIRAEESPNVILAMKEIALGRKPSHKIVVPGVLNYAEYLERRTNWDKVKQCVSLDADWYEGAENRLYPVDWLNRAELIAANLSGRHRLARAIGADCAMGGDKTAYAVSDEKGLIYLEAKKTPDTSIIGRELIALMNRYNVEPENVCLDAGGGGHQIADQLREKGYNVRTVMFGEMASQQVDDKVKRTNPYRPRESKIEEYETKYIYKNRRAEMYGLLNQLLNPQNEGWGIPAEYAELRRQLAAIPLWYDEEGRLYLPPKQRKGHEDDADDGRKMPTMQSLIGCSPDEADAVVLSIFAMVRQSQLIEVGAA